MEQPTLSRVDHLVLTVANPDATIAFYCQVLGMQHRPFQVANGTTRHALSFGQQKINLHKAGAEFDPKAKNPGPGTADLCFLSDHPLDLWRAHFDATGTAVEEGPVRRTGATGPITSLYVRDPDGNLIEVGVAD